MGPAVWQRSPGRFKKLGRKVSASPGSDHGALRGLLVLTQPLKERQVHLDVILLLDLVSLWFHCGFWCRLAGHNPLGLFKVRVGFGDVTYPCKTLLILCRDRRVLYCCLVFERMICDLAVLLRKHVWAFSLYCQNGRAYVSWSAHCS